MANTYQEIANRAVKVAEDVLANRLINKTGHYCSAGQPALGVTKYDANSGETTALTTDGTALIKAAAELAVGDWAKAATGGQIVKGATTNDFCIGMVVGGCSTGDLAEVKLQSLILSVVI